MRALVIIIMVLMVLAGYTNPGIEKHREAVSSEVNRCLEEEVKRSDSSSITLEKLGEELGLNLGKRWIRNITHEAVGSQNYVLFSVTTLHLGMEKRNIGIGLFGFVHLLDNFDEALLHMQTKGM
jgi:hypothetical protein